MQHGFLLSRKSQRFLGSAMGIAIVNRKNRCDFGALKFNNYINGLLVDTSPASQSLPFVFSVLLSSRAATRDRLCTLWTSSQPKKTMKVRDMTGFYAFFFARESDKLLPILVRVPYQNYTENLEKQGKFHLRKLKIQWGQRPRNCGFLSLVVVERVLTVAAWFLENVKF